MYRSLTILILLMFLSLVPGMVTSAEKQEQKPNTYLAVEGGISSINGRMLVINGQQYPISKFVRVFNETGHEIPLHTVAGIGKIDKAKVYVLGGKAEKIVVIKNL